MYCKGYVRLRYVSLPLLYIYISVDLLDFGFRGGGFVLRLACFFLGSAGVPLLPTFWDVNCIYE